jgi:hypothetical protein
MRISQGILPIAINAINHLNDLGLSNTGMITTTSKGIAATTRRRSSTPMFVNSTTDINGGSSATTNGSEEGVAAVDAALFGLVVDDASKVTLANTVVEEARELLAMENEILGPDGAPLAPMMTYQKYVTMQVSVCIYIFG